MLILINVSRLQEVAGSCITVWTKKMQSDYSRYLKKCEMKLHERKAALKEKINGNSISLKLISMHVRSSGCMGRSCMATPSFGLSYTFGLQKTQLVTLWSYNILAIHPIENYLLAIELCLFPAPP